MPKGSIVLVPFPFTDLKGQKVRPALVLHNNQRGEDCIVCFISSQIDKKNSRFHVQVDSSSSNGLKGASCIKVDKLATLQKKIVLGELGKLETSYLKRIDLVLKQVFGLK